MKRTILYLLFIVILSLLATACSTISASEPTATPTAEPTATMEPADKPEVVSSFDASRSELPEGIAIDTAGNIYVSLGPPLFVGGGFGEIWKISPDGTETTLAQFEGGRPAAGLAAAGLAVALSVAPAAAPAAALAAAAAAPPALPAPLAPAAA